MWHADRVQMRTDPNGISDYPVDEPRSQPTRRAGVCEAAFQFFFLFQGKNIVWGRVTVDYWRDTWCGLAMEGPKSNQVGPIRPQPRRIVFHDTRRTQSSLLGTGPEQTIRTVLGKMAVIKTNN